MALQRPTLAPFKKETITHIFIGIDFGTSYTKVSYSYAPNQVSHIQTIKWEDDFFKQTILYLQNERLYFDKPNGDFKDVKYFKYSIIEKNLKNTTFHTKNNFEEMCCVYFLAHVIKRSLKKIQEELRIENIDEIKITVNMGCPLENFYEGENGNNKDLYNDILKNAVLLAGGSRVKAILPKNQVLIKNLDEVYSELAVKEAFPKWNISVYPELAAEIMLYHQAKTVPDGVYAVIDVGGGTVDMALFQKSTAIYKKNAEMTNLAQKVLPFGIEVLNNDPKKVSAKLLKEEFAKMFKETKNNVWINYSLIKKIFVFFLGGGASNDWYSNNIFETKKRLRAAGFPELEFSRNLQDFINIEEKLVEKNQRLIISQMLARHTDDIENVKGFPDFYKDQQNKIHYDSSYLEKLLDYKSQRYKD